MRQSLHQEVATCLAKFIQFVHLIWTHVLACAFATKWLTRPFRTWRISFHAAFQSTSGAGPAIDLHTMGGGRLQPRTKLFLAAVPSGCCHFDYAYVIYLVRLTPCALNGAPHHGIQEQSEKVRDRTWQWQRPPCTTSEVRPRTSNLELEPRTSDLEPRTSDLRSRCQVRSEIFRPTECNHLNLPLTSPLRACRIDPAQGPNHPWCQCHKSTKFSLHITPWFHVMSMQDT